MRVTCFALFLAVAGMLPVAAADNVSARLGRAVTVLNSLTGAKNGIRPAQIAGADCVAVIPGFKKGAAVVGVGFGRGFIFCRTGNGWSAPGSVKLESSSLGVQVGGEEIDVVILSLDKARREKLLSDRFTVGSDASAAWGNGKSAHDDPNAKILFFGRTSGIFAGFGLDGASLSLDESSNKVLYGKSITNREVVEGATETPAAAKPLVAKLASVTNP